MTFKLEPAASITSASTLSVRLQNNASIPATFFTSSLCGITDASGHELNSHLTNNRDGHYIHVDFVARLLTWIAVDQHHLVDSRIALNIPLPSFDSYLLRKFVIFAEYSVCFAFDVCAVRQCSMPARRKFSVKH